MKVVTYYETDDGETFQSESEAEAHEVRLEFQRRIDRMLPALEANAYNTIGEVRARSHRRTVVLEFLLAEREAEFSGEVIEEPDGA